MYNRTLFLRALSMMFTASILVGLASYSLGQTDNQSFTIFIAMPEATVKSGSRVQLNVTFKNQTNEMIILATSRANARGSGIVVRDEAGSVFRLVGNFDPETPYRINGHGVAVEPKKSANETIDLASYFDLTKPGGYSVQMRRKDRITQTQVLSNTLILTVTP